LTLGLSLVSSLQVLIFGLPWTPLPLQISYAAVVVALVYRCIKFQTEKTRASGVLTFGLVCYGTGGVLWVIEKRMSSQGRCAEINALHLHALWHLGTGIGTFVVLQYFTQVRRVI
jgi:predicted membrane channel-forming protein YqfA (hemolysin III family)